MWNSLKLLFLLCWINGANAQTWQWTEVSPMPFPTTNNAVCGLDIGGEQYMYSFGGLDSTKIWSGIHNRCFRYTVSSDQWTEIDSLPETLPVIAAAASVVKNKIYIIGGYHVYATGNESSSNKVHIYDPVAGSFAPDGASIPLPIDDHVQCVWRDSLIFVVTGWSNSGNVPAVQIYDPGLDQWQSGTQTPASAYYTAFGASGYILGDTLYYHGGAAGGSFLARKYMRKGYIDPADPTNITWTLMADAPGDAGYRSACSGTDNTIFWVGGSPKSYNYDGIAYDGSGGVDPSARVLHFNNSVYEYSDEINQPFGVMDLRGIAELGNNRWAICGGMDTNQVVSARTFILETNSVGMEKTTAESMRIRDFGDRLEIALTIPAESILLDMTGKEVVHFKLSDKIVLKRADLPAGIYVLVAGEARTRLRI